MNPTVELNGEVQSVQTARNGLTISITPTDATSLGGGENEKANAGELLTFLDTASQGWTTGGAVTIVITQTASA